MQNLKQDSELAFFLAIPVLNELSGQFLFAAGRSKYRTGGHSQHEEEWNDNIASIGSQDYGKVTSLVRPNHLFPNAGQENEKHTP